MSVLALTLQSPQHWPVSMIVIVLGLLSLLVYRPSVDAMRGVWRWVSPTVRMLAFAAIAGAVLQPTVSRTLDPMEREILILVDRSASMSVVDAPPTPAELVRLADGLGLLPPESRVMQARLAQIEPRRLPRLVVELQRRAGEREYARLVGQPTAAFDAEIATLLAEWEQARTESRTRAEAEPAGQELLPLIDTLVLDSVSAATLQQSAERVAQLRQRIDVLLRDADHRLHADNAEVRSVCASIAGRSRLELAMLIAQDGPDALVSRLSAMGKVRLAAFAGSPLRWIEPGEVPRADGPASEISLAIQGAIGRARDGGLAGIVLLSDGREIGAAGETSPMPALVEGVPVFAVPVARASVRDLSVADVRVRSTAYVGEPVTVHVILRSRGMPVNDAQVTVSMGDETVSRTVTVEADQRAEVRVELPARRAGIITLEARVAPVDGEISPINNVMRREVRVIEQSAPVLLLAGSNRRDVVDLASLLGRTAWVALESHIAPLGRSLDVSPDAIDRAELIVLADVDAPMLDTARWMQIEAMVRSGRTTVLVLAGDTAALRSLGSTEHTRWLLPWRAGSDAVWRSWPGERASFRIAPESSALSHELVRLDDDPAESRRRWYELPAVYRILSMPPLRPGVRVLLRELDSQSPVLTEARIENGRVLVVGLSELWRWADDTTSRRAHPVLEQIVRSGIERPYAANNGVMRFDVDPPAPAPGESVRLRARHEYDDFRESDSPPTVQLRGNGDEQTIALQPSATRAGRFDAVIGGLAPGQYLLSLRDGQLEGPSLSLTVWPRYDAELADLSGDVARLRELADRSGGAFVLPEDLATLPALLADQPSLQLALVDVPLWRSWLVYLLIVGCFSLEWAVRKLHGLL